MKAPIKVKVLVSQFLPKSVPSPRVNVWVSDQTRRQSTRQQIHSPVTVTCADVAEHQRAQGHTYLWMLGVQVGAIALSLSSGWLALQLIINPGSVRWLNWLLPEGNRTPLVQQLPQTIAEIETEASQMGWRVGQPVYLSTYPGMTREQVGFSDFLLPIFAKGQLIELRAYRLQPQANRSGGTAPRFALVDWAGLEGPREADAIAPLTQDDCTLDGSDRPLALTRLDFIENKSVKDNPPGIWFQLSGEWKRGSTHLLYGQVLRYNPQRTRLEWVMAWSSPAGELPHWQQVTASQTPELVVDQTVGLEPQFQVYQVQMPRSPVQPVRLVAIDLKQPLLSDSSYRHSLLLADAGLWSPALALLQSLKRSGAMRSRTAQVQAQMDVIALHAKVTQAEANRAWASPTQQILMQLLDGRWAKALTLSQAAHKQGYNLRELLAAHADVIAPRVEAALQVAPAQTDLQSWKTLLLAVQRDRTTARQWLQQQRRPASLQPQTLLALLEDSTLTPPPPAIAAATPPLPLSSSPHSSPPHSPSLPTPATPQLLGSATPLSALNPTDWTTPTNTPLLKPSPSQTWYVVDVIGFGNGKQWQSAPWTALSQAQEGRALWSRLGLAPSSSIQLVVWDPAGQAQSQEVTVQAVRFDGDRLQLLAVGERSQRPSMGARPPSPAYLGRSRARP